MEKKIRQSMHRKNMVVTGLSRFLRLQNFQNK